MTRHEIHYDAKISLIPIAGELEMLGARIYHLNKDTGTIGADIPDERLEEIRRSLGITLSSEPDSTH